MTPAEHQLLRALYLHALAPSTAKQDAVRAAGAALDTETGRKLNGPRDAPNEAATLNAGQILISAVGDDDAQWGWQVWDDVGELSAEGVVPSLAVALAQVAGVVNAPRPPDCIAMVSVEDMVNTRSDRCHYDSDAPVPVRERRPRPATQPSELPIAEAVSRKILDRAAFGLRKYGVSLDDAGHSPVALLTHLQEELMDGANYVEAFKRAMMAATAPVEPPHAATPALATLTPEPAEAVLGRAGEALAWDGRQPPVWVEFEPGVRHPYGDAAFHVAAHVTPDGKARLFPSREAANVWLCANGTWPV